MFTFQPVHWDYGCSLLMFTFLSLSETAKITYCWKWNDLSLKNNNFMSFRLRSQRRIPTATSQQEKSLSLNYTFPWPFSFSSLGPSGFTSFENDGKTLLPLTLERVGICITSPFAGLCTWKELAPAVSFSSNIIFPKTHRDCGSVRRGSPLRALVFAHFPLLCLKGKSK